MKKQQPKTRAKRSISGDVEFIWARNEEQAVDLQHFGWTLAQGVTPTHHNQYAILLARPAKG